MSRSLPAAPFDLQIAVFGLLLAAAAWLALELLARRFPSGSLGRTLLRQARLCVGVTLALSSFGWWLFRLLDRAGWALPRDGREVRDGLLTLGLIWTLLRLKGTLLRHAAGDPRWLAERGEPDRALLLDLGDKLLTGVVVLVGGLELLRQLGVSAALLLTASGIGAAAVGFGAKTVVENLLSGAMLYITRPFGLGDRIELPDRKLAGTVQAIGAYHSELLTDDRQPLYLPNSLFGIHAIVNVSRRPHRRLQLTVSLRPEDRVRIPRITDALRQELAHTPGIDPLQPRRVHLVGYGENGPVLEVECFTGSDLDAYLRLRQDLLLRISEVVEGNGGTLLFPGLAGETGGRRMAGPVAEG